MKKRLNSSILAATSLTAITVQHQAEASTLVLTEAQLSTLSPSNQLESSDVTTLDFSNLTPEIVNSLKLVSIDLSKFQNVRNIIWPWFASNLKLTLPVNFNTPQNDTYSRLTIIGAGVAPSSDSDFTLNLESLLSQSGKIILDTKAVPVTELKTGSAVAKIERNVATTAITVPDTIEAIDTDGVIPNDVKTSVTLVPSVANPTDKVPFVGLPVAVIGTNASSLNISAYSVAGQDVAVSGMPNLTTLITAAGDNIGSLKVTGETTVTTNAASINKVEFTSTAPDQTVVTTMSSTATTVAPTAKESHLASFAGKTELDFSKLDLGTTDATASRIKDIFDGPVPITSIVSMKIGSSVLAAVMAKLSITSLSSFSALKRLDIISATGAYQPTTLASSDLPSSLEEFYSSTLVVRKGTLSADLEFDSKFSAATLDLNGLNINGKNLTIAGSFTANSVNTLKLNPSLLAASATKNLISASSSKSIIVSGAASGALTTTHLQNVGTIDLRTVTGATSFSAPLDVDGNNSNLNKLYLPSAFDVEAAADILSGVDNGEVTVYISGAYSGAKTLDASYDKTILNFSGVTGTGRFQLPAGVRGLVLSDAVKGINVGAAAVVNNFDFSGLTRLRQITDLPTSATVLKLSNSSASSALELNLAALTSLTTLSLGSSKVSQLSLPATATLTNGGGIEHLDLSSVTDLAVLNGLNALLAAGSIKQVSFPTNPASALHINLVDTITGITFNNLDKVPTVTLDSDYSLGNGLSNNMWPTVKSKLEKADWSHFFKYIIAPVDQGGINSPSVFDLSGQAIESQAQATAFIAALNELSQSGKQLIQKIIIRIDAATTGAIDLSAIVPTDFTHNSLKIIIDQSTGSAATVTVSSEWTSKTKTYVSLDQVSKTTTASWTNYLNYRFGSLNDKGQGATSLDLSWIDLSAAEWTALMTTLNTFSSANVIETMHLKLVAANNYSSAPAFTTATLSAAKSIIVDVTGVKNSGAQVTVTGLPSATVSLQVEQRVTDASAVNRTTASSWKGYLEHLLSNISGTNYTLDLTASAVNIDVDTQLTALNSALAGLSAESKLKIKNINLKIAPGEREANFTVSTNFTGFTNLASLVVDATGALNSPNQSAITFSLTNAPTYAKAHVTSLDSVIKNSAASWEYYFAHRLATDGVLLTNLDVSAISLSSQADLTAFLTALHGQSTNDKSSVQSIKLKLASTYTNSSVDFSVSVGSGQISGLTHASFAVEVDRNGANNTAPVTFTFGTAITANKTTIKDTAFTSLGSFDGANAHHWLGYVRALLAPITSGTTTLDLSAHSILEMNNAKVAKFITAMNALPTTDKAKIATLKVKLASGDFGAATADLSGLSGFTNLTALVVDRNGARTSATLYNPAVSITGSGTVTVNDPELGTVSSTGETNKWLGYLRFVLNGMSGVANTLDVSAFAIDSANAATAFNNAFQALPASEKLKVQTLKLAASAVVTLGTSVTGFTNLTKVIVDQTAAPTVAITITTGFGTTQKTYVTSASTAQTNNAWAKYIDYAMSSVANGGLNQTTFDLTGLTLDSTQVSAFLAGFTIGQKAAVTAITLKLNSTFGAASLAIDGSGFNSTATAFTVHRNGAVNGSPAIPVAISLTSPTGASSISIIDPTAGTVADQTKAQDWLKYLTGVLNDAASSYVLDLRSKNLSLVSHVTAFNAALNALDSALKAKVDQLWLTVSATDGSATLGTSVAGFTNLTKVIVDQTAASTTTITIASGFADTATQKFYVTSAATAQTNTAWAKYIDYAMSSVANGGLNQTTFDLTGLTLDSTQVSAFLAGFTIGQKAAVTAITLKLNSTFGAASLAIDGSGFNSTATAFTVHRNGAVNGNPATPVAISLTSPTGASSISIIDPTATTVADQTSAQDWLKYLNGILTDAAGSYVLDLRSKNLSLVSHVTAFNAALTALDTSLKVKVAELKLTVTAAGELGTGVSGFTNLTKVIVDQTAAPTTTITIANGFGTTQKTYVTSALANHTNTAWAKYIDYAMSSTVNGGLNQTTFDLTGLTLDSTQLGQFFTGFTSGQKATVTAITLKLATTFGANSLTLPTPTSFTSLTGVDAFKIYRNSAANSGTLVSVDYNGWGDSVVQIIDPTATTVADQTSAQDWLKYLSYVTSQSMFDATSGLGAQNGVLDLSSLPLATSGQAVALISALELLDSSLKAKLKAIDVKLATGNFGTGTLALSGDLRSSAGFTNLTKFMVDATGTETNVSGTQKTVDFTNLLSSGSKDMWVTSLASVDYDSGVNAAASWLAYIHYQIRNNDTNFALDTSAINSGAGLTVAQAGYVFDALATLSATGTNKARLTSVNVKLANAGGAATLAVSQNLSNLNGLTSIIVNATDAMHSTDQVAVTFSGTFHASTTTNKAIVSSLSSVDKDSEASWTYFFNTAAMTSIDVSSIALNSAEATAFLAALGSGITPKTGITAVTMKLATTFGANSLTLPTPTSFTSLTGVDAFKIYRNSAANSGTLVSVDYNGWGASSISIIDPTATTVADQTSAQDWLKYLNGILTDATSSYVLDLRSKNLSLVSHVTAFNAALTALDTSLKVKVAELKLTVTAAGELGTGVSGFTLTKVIVDQTAAPTASITIANGFCTTQKTYVTSALANHTNTAWAKYIDYAMSSVANGGLNQTAFDLTGLTLTNAQVGQFLTALDAHASAASVTAITLKLASNFGAASLDLSSYTGLTGLIDDGVIIYRNSAAHSNAPVTVTYGGSGASFVDDKVKLIDPTATTVTDKTKVQDWLKYLSYVTSQSMFDATSGLGAQNSVLDLSSLPLAVTSEAPALISALILLDSSLKAKLKAIHIKFATGDLGGGAITLSGDLSSSAGFTNLTKFIVDVTETYENASATQKIVDFTGLSVDGSKDMWVTKLSSVDYISTNAPASWLAYINYKIRNNDADLVIDTSALNSDGITVTEAGYLFNALENLSTSTNLNKHRLIAVGIKLDTLDLDGGAATLTVNQDLSSLSGLLALLVNTTEARYAGAQVAVDFSGGTFHANTQLKLALVYKLSAVDKGSINSWKYLFNTSTDIGDQNFWKYYFNVDAMTSVDVSSTTLTSAEATAFFTALNAYSGAGNINTISLKLDPTFGAASLDLSSYTGFTSLANDGVVIYRNGSSTDGNSAPITITYGGSGASFVDDKVKIIDPTATTVTDTASAQQWLGYLTGVLNDAASEVTLDLSSIAIDDAEAVTAFNAALNALDSALRNKITLFKLTVTHTADITLGTGIHGFDGLTRIEFTKPATNTVTFADALSGKRTYLTSFDSVKMNTAADWTRYLNYMLSTTAGGQSASSLNLNSLTFANQTAVDAFFAGLNTLSGSGVYGNKSALTTLRMKLADGQSAISIGRINNTPTAATGLAAGLHVIVDPGTSTGTTPAGSAANTVQADNLIVLDSVAAFSKDHIAYLAEQPSFAGTIDLTALNYTNTTDVVAALNLLSADIKAKIKTINLKLQSGTFGSLSLTLGALTGFTDVTFNIDRNGAIDGVNTYGSLVTITNSTTHTVNLTDAEFHNMSTFDKTSSANWIGYLTHELNSAPENYTLDLTINAALYLDSTSSVGAFSNALRYLPDNLKTRVALLKVRSSTNGDFGATDWNGPGATERVIPEYAAFDHLNSIVIEYTATGLAMGAYIGHLTNTNKYAYITTPFDGMDWNDWTKYVDYQLNAANLGGLTKTSISLDKHLSSSELSAVLTGLDAAAGKASLVNLTLNLASSITGDINVGASGLTNLASVIINTNGSAARLTPSDEFYNKTAWTSVLNVNPAVQESWRAYLKGQSSIAAIDIREIELADQDQLTAFLTALNAEDRKANIATIKIKLASSYTGTVSFATVNTTGLTALTANNSVEIHRNGSAATAVQGGNITDAKIKLVDLTASSLTNRSNADSWRRYLTTLIEATPGAIDLSLDSDTYLRSNAHVTAFMTALQNLSPANKLLVTSLKLELAPGAAWTNITALGQGLTGFTNLTSFIVDATDATVSGTQVTVAFHVDLTTASPKAIVSSLNSVDKDSQDSWTYFFNSAAMTTVNVSSTTLTSAEAGAFLAALGTGTTAKADITSLTLKLDSTFGAGSLSLNGSGLTGLQTVDAVSIQRNGAENAGSLVSVSLSNGLTSTHVRIVDQTITDADAVIKTSASSWLSYLTYALDGSVTELVLTDDNLVLGTQGQATALSSALDALDPSLKAKAVTLKVKAAADVTIGATLTTAGDFSALTVIELDKPAANTITISTKEATTQLHIADLEKVKRDSSADWLAYTQYLMKSLGVITNFDLDMTSNPLASGDVTAFITALQNLSPANKLKIQKVKLKLASGAWTGNVADLGQGTSGFDNLDTFTVDATNATVSGTQVTVTFHSDLSTASPKVFVTTLDSVDKDNDAAWTYYLNSLTKDGAAALDLSSITLSPTELTALDSGLDAFSTADNNEGLLSSIHIKVSGAAGAATVNLTADLNAQTAINSAAKFIVEISGFTHASSQAVVEHTGGTPKDIELRISGASDVYRNSAASWNLYLNYVKATNSNAMPTTLDLTSSSNLYLRSQADVNALMTAIQARSDKANITTLDVRLAPGSVGSDITFGIGVSDNFNPIMDITVTGATNNGSLLTTSDIHYAGSFTSTGKTLTQAFASTVLNLTVEAHWTSYLQYVLSSTADGGLGQVSIVPPALTSGALTALLNALNNLSAPLKTSIQHLHLDVSHASFNGGLTLGTGVSGLSNLQEVTYVRASNQADATAAASSSFENKLQRLRTAWNSDALTDAAAVGEYLRYVLMDTAMGGAELTTVDLTSQILDADKDGYVYTALGNLPSELISRTTELRLKLNTNSGGNYSNITLPNLTTVKYFQTGNAIFVAPTSTQTVTTTRFRASETNVTDKTAQAQWTNYIDYVMSSTANGGLNQTTFDLSSITLTSAQATAFLAALAAHTSKASITAITLKLDPTFGAASLDLSTYTGFTDLSADSVTIQRNAAVHANTPVTITYGVGAGKLTDANVKIIDPETHTTANKDNTRQEWLEYLTHTIHTTGLTSGLLTIEPSNAFSSQAETYRLFDAMEALDPSLKSAVNRIIIDISSIPSGKVYLMRTDDAALTGFTSLTNVIYKRAGVDTNVGSIVDDLNSALKANFALDAIPTWVRADNTERDNAINSALQEGNEVWSAIRAGNATELKSQLVTKLAQGVTFPTSDAFDDIVVDAAAAVEVTVDGDVKSTLETALTPFRSTGKIATIGSTLTTVFTNGSTTGLGTLSWLKTSWTGYANHTAFMTAVLADNDVTTAIETDGQTVADIKTAVTNYLDNFLLPYGTIAGGSAAGSLGKIIFDMNLSSLTNWNNGSSIETRNAFRDALENAIRGLLETAWSWFTPGTISNAVNEIFPAEDGYFPLPITSGDWDATAIKQELFDRLKGIDNSNVIGFSAIKSSIPNMINGAFTAGNATLTTNTAAWVRPTVGIESDLTTSIEDALNAFPWYTGNAEEQALDAVAAGGVATNDAATIITNIQAWLTANVSFPTPESIFEAGVDEVLATINLEVVGATVTTDFGDDATLSRYRIAISDITDKENAGQWTEYLLHKLAPVSEGGLGATTIDVSSVDLGNDHVTHFWGALRDGIDDYRTSITSIKFALDNSGGDVTLDGGGKTYNDNLKIIVVMNNKATNTFTLGTGGSGFKNSSNADLSNSIIDHHITELASVSPSSSISWGYYLNYLKATNSNIESIDLSTRDLADTDSGTTQPYVNAFFTALQARADHSTVKDIFFDISGLDNLTVAVGTGSSGLTALTSVVVKRHAGGESMILAAGGVGSQDRAIINSATGTLGAGGNVFEWKGYLAYLLEDSDHGGAYTGSNPIPLNLSAGDLCITTLQVLQALETALIELPDRLKARVSAILIKIAPDSIDYTASGEYEFGDAFTSPILTKFNGLKTVVIDASICAGTKPVFDTNGAFYNAATISKIVY